jgi:hypothetical protein
MSAITRRNSKIEAILTDSQTVDAQVRIKRLGQPARVLTFTEAVAELMADKLGDAQMVGWRGYRSRYDMLKDGHRITCGNYAAGIVVDEETNPVRP